jgi:carboxypeptidase C (cathepsin A)
MSALIRLSYLLLTITLAWSQTPASVGSNASINTISLKEEQPVSVTKTTTLNGKNLKYTATTGFMPLKTESGDIEAQLFYVAYTVEGTPSDKRPLMICFNGGPGAGSLWLHLGAIGPKRVKMLDDGSMPPAPYKFVDNEGTWLEKADLVFVDPVGTGYSRAKNPDVAKKFFSLQGDIASIGTFVRMYLDRHKRWNSPLFLAGESYGTTRAAGLSNHLFERGIALNGIILVSTILNFQTARFARGNDLPYSLFLPTYTAIAWYHKKLPSDLQGNLQKAIQESRQFALNEYPGALQKGDLLSAAEKKATLDKLIRLTGLSREFLEQSDLRVEIQRFCKELLRDQSKTVGRLDGRLTALETPTGERPEFDPSLTAIRPPYTAAMNQYARESLEFNTEREYFALGGGISSRWDFGINETGSGQGSADTSEPLRTTMAKNPFMRVMIASGYYDLATPFHAAEYTVSHMALPPELRKNISFAEYEAGHMMYIHVPSLRKLQADVSKFVDSSLPR